MAVVKRVCIYQNGKLKEMSLPLFDYKINGTRSRMFVRMNKGKYRYIVFGKNNVKLVDGIRYSKFTYWRPITHIEIV